MKRCLFVLLLSAISAGAQTIEGDVLNAVTGAPVTGAYISSSNSKGFGVIARTDVAGHFRAPQSSAPAFMLQVFHPGFLSLTKALLRNSDGMPGPIRIELTPGSAISGTIDDEDGVPVKNASVQAVHYRIVNGQRTLQPAASTQSDDLGRYRLRELPAGRYWVYANAGDLGNWDRRYSGGYFGGTLQPDANHRVEIGAGQEVDKVDIHLVRHEGATVSGRLELPAGTPPGFFPVSLQSELDGGRASFFVPAQRDGAFIISHVTPGTYILHTGSSRGSVPAAGDLWGQQRIEVGETDITDVTVPLRVVQPVEISGTAQMMDGGNAPAVFIGLRGAYGVPITARTNPDGSFLIKGVLPGHYDLQISPDAAAQTENRAARFGIPMEARFGEKDVLTGGFDVDGPPPGPLRLTFRSRAIELNGKLVDAAGSPVAHAYVMAMPSIQGYRATQADGTFKLGLLRAGDYHLYVLTDPMMWNDADYLDQHANDYPVVTVVDGPNPPIVLIKK